MFNIESEKIEEVMSNCLQKLFFILMCAQISSCNLAPTGSSSGSISNPSLIAASKNIHDAGIFSREIEVKTESVVPFISELNSVSTDASLLESVEIDSKQIEIELLLDEVAQEVDGNSDSNVNMQVSEAVFIDNVPESVILSESLLHDSEVVNDSVVDAILSDSLLVNESGLYVNDTVFAAEYSHSGFSLSNQSSSEDGPLATDVFEIPDNNESGEIESIVETELLVTLESYSPALNATDFVNIQEYFINEGESLIAIDLLANFVGIENAHMQIIDFSQGFNATVIKDQNGLFNYIPTKRFYGRDEFTFRAESSAGVESMGKVVVVVNPVNHLPIAKMDSVVVPNSYSADLLLLNNDEGLEDGVEISLVSTPLNGSLELSAEGIAHYSPHNGFVGEDGFVYKLTDKDGDFSVANVSIRVECVTDCYQAITLSWEPSVSVGVAGYKVYVGSSPTEYTSAMTVDNVTEFHYVAKDRGVYYFSVSAFDEQQNESELSEQVNVKF